MGLPWVRLDANVAGHDKFLALMADKSAKKWQAIASYFFALAWSGGQGTDGKVPLYALQMVHGTPATARLLVKYHLWTEHAGEWRIVNYDKRQELTLVADSKRQQVQLASRKANCVRWHGVDCGCWKESA